MTEKYLRIGLNFSYHYCSTKWTDFTQRNLKKLLIYCSTIITPKCKKWYIYFLKLSCSILVSFTKFPAKWEQIGENEPEINSLQADTGKKTKNKLMSEWMLNQWMSEWLHKKDREWTRPMNRKLSESFIKHIQKSMKDKINFLILSLSC